MAYNANAVSASELFEAAQKFVPEFVRDSFWGKVKRSHDDVHFAYIYDNSEAAATTLHGLLLAECEELLSEKMCQQIEGQIENYKVHQEVNYHFAQDKDELTLWQEFDEHLARNEARWAYEDRIEMYRKEY